MTTARTPKAREGQDGAATPGEPPSVGKSVSHESAEEHVTGRAKYVDDLWPSIGRVAHAWPVMAPHAHARVLGIDAQRATEQPGVLAVLTAADVPGENDVGPVRHDEPLFPSEVSFHGQAVAWVLAESEEQARWAAPLVAVTYEPLPAVLSIEHAIASESFLTEPERMRRGHPEAAILAAPHRLEGAIFLNGQEHFYLETQAALAFVDEAGAVFVHASTQHPSETQDIVARVLGLHAHEVIVQCVRMGGAFGGKEVQANAWAAIAAIGAKKLGRPVRVRLTRAQDMALTGKRHPFLARFRVGFSGDGRLGGLEIWMWSDGGWSLDLSAPVLSRAMFHADNCYLVSDVEIIGRVCRTHRVSNTAFRGFGGPQGMVIIEDILDRVARHLDLPPHAVRLANFYRDGDTTHYGQVVSDADRITRIWTDLQERSDFAARWSEIASYNGDHAHTKRGLAITPVKFGISFTTAAFNQAGALVLIYRDGSVQVNHGGTEMGQGLHTKIRQIAADGLGLGLAAIRIMPTRTDKIPNTSATAASAGSDLNGAAVRAACDALRARLAEVAARRLGVPASDMVFAGGCIATVDGAASVTFGEVVSQAYFVRGPRFATGFDDTPYILFDKQSGTV